MSAASAVLDSEFKTTSTDTLFTPSGFKISIVRSVVTPPSSSATTILVVAKLIAVGATASAVVPIYSSSP